MKVLVISHTYIAPINRDKWQTFAQRHPQVNITVAFPRQWQSLLFNHTAEDAQPNQEANCTFIAFDTFNTGNELIYGYKPRQLYNLLKSLRPDIIHVEQGAGALCYLQIHLFIKLLRLKTKSVFFTWVNWHAPLSIKTRLYAKFAEKINFACARGAIAGNHEAKKILEQKGFTKPILVLPQLGVNNTIFKRLETTTSLDKTVKYIGYIGRLTEEKGIFYLVHAFLKLSKQFPDWKLVFIGKGPAGQRLQSFVAIKQMLHRIEFCKPVPHEMIAQYLQRIDILVLPSYDTTTWREQFGHVIIEAMSCNVPVIGSDAGEIPHVIGDTGLIFKQRNETDLLAQLKTLMQDECLRKKLGALGQHRAFNEYSHEAIADRTYTFWRQLLE